MRQEQGGPSAWRSWTMTRTSLVECSLSRRAVGPTLVGTLPVTRRRCGARGYALAPSIILVTAALVVVIAPQEGLPERLGMTGVVVAVPLFSSLARCHPAEGSVRSVQWFQ